MIGYRLLIYETETGIECPTSSLRKFSIRLDVTSINETLTNGASLHMYYIIKGSTNQCTIKSIDKNDIIVLRHYI